MTEQTLRPLSLESSDGGQVDTNGPKIDRNLEGGSRPDSSRSNDGKTTDTRSTKVDRGSDEE